VVQEVAKQKVQLVLLLPAQSEQQDAVLQALLALALVQQPQAERLAAPL
jgi:hypothetical protein